MQSTSWKNARLEEAQAGIKIAGRNINKLRYADDTTLMAESEKLKNILMKVKEENGKAGLKINIQKAKIMASGPITSWQIDGEKLETMTDFFLLGFKITVDGVWSHEIKGHLLLCRGRAWGTPPMAKVMRKEAWHTQRRDQASGNPLFPSI